jgi:hypothetical protein
VFAARYELNSYIVFRKRLVSKRLIIHPVSTKYLPHKDNVCGSKSILVTLLNPSRGRHCATSLKVAGSIPDEVNEFL